MKKLFSVYGRDKFTSRSATILERVPSDNALMYYIVPDKAFALLAVGERTRAILRRTYFKEEVVEVERDE